MRKKLLFCLFLAGPLCLTVPACSAGLTSAHFNLSFDDSLDKYKLLQQLGTNYFVHLESVQTQASDIDSLLKSAFEGLYIEVSDILDIHLESLRIDLVILPDKAAIKSQLAQYIDNPPELESFYYYENNTIYISGQDLTAGMLGHEISHAIISRYFTMAPSAKDQEILSGYVEYSIRNIEAKLNSRLVSLEGQPFGPAPSQ